MRGPDVWLLRRSDKSISAKRIYRKRVIGTVEEYPQALIARINAADPRIGLCSTTAAVSAFDTPNAQEASTHAATEHSFIADIFLIWCS
jgi:hypothetical protein